MTVLDVLDNVRSLFRYQIIDFSRHEPLSLSSAWESALSLIFNYTEHHITNNLINYLIKIRFFTPLSEPFNELSESLFLDSLNN